MAVQFKFREKARAAHRKSVVERVKGKGKKVSVKPLFPGEKDPELASLYKAEGVPDDVAPELASSLGSDAAIEFAEPSPDRKLIR